MAYGPSEFRVWQGIARKARCKYCHRPIVWRTSDENKNFAFDPNAQARRVDQHPVTFAKYDVIGIEHLHSRSCPNRAERAAAARKKKRKATFAAQGRLL